MHKSNLGRLFKGRDLIFAWRLLGKPSQLSSTLYSISQYCLSRCFTETQSLTPNSDGKNPFTRRRPRAGPSSYGETLLLIDSCVTERDKERTEIIDTCIIHYTCKYMNYTEDAKKKLNVSVGQHKKRVLMASNIDLANKEMRERYCMQP